MLERKPESSEEAGKLADDFQQARKFEKKEFRRSEDCRWADNKAVRNCLSCGKPGHLARDCKMKATGSGGQKSPKYKKEVECFNSATRRDIIPHSVLIMLCIALKGGWVIEVHQLQYDGKVLLSQESSRVV